GGAAGGGPRVGRRWVGGGRRGAPGGGSGGAAAGARGGGAAAPPPMAPTRPAAPASLALPPSRPRRLTPVGWFFASLMSFSSGSSRGHLLRRPPGDPVLGHGRAQAG